MNSRDGRLRSPRAMVLLLAALTTALAALAGMLWLRDRGSDGVPLQGEPMTDAQAAGQVVASAKQIVGTAQLHDAAGGYAFVSCKNENEPPYQVAIYMTFVCRKAIRSSICATSGLPWWRTGGLRQARWASTSVRS